VKIWLDGRLREAGEAAISPLDRGLTLGDGLFETILVTGGAARRLEAHLARLAHGAGVIGRKLPEVDWAGTIAETMAANGLADGVARLTVTRGAGPRGVLPPADATPTVMVTAGPPPPERGPAHCIVSRL